MLGNANVPATMPGGPTSGVALVLRALASLPRMHVVSVSEWRTSAVRYGPVRPASSVQPPADLMARALTVPTRSHGVAAAWDDGRQDCPCCGHALGPLPGDFERVWRVRVCAWCGIIWHRDVSAGTAPDTDGHPGASELCSATRGATIMLTPLAAVRTGTVRTIPGPYGRGHAVHRQAPPPPWIRKRACYPSGPGVGLPRACRSCCWSRCSCCSRRSCTCWTCPGV